MPRLVSLIIIGDFKGWQSPFDFSRLRHLQYYETLKCVGVEVEVPETMELVPFGDGDDGAAGIEANLTGQISLQWIQVRGQIADGDEDGALGIVEFRLAGFLASPLAIKFITHFPSLTSLTLYYTCDQSDIVPLVEAAPTTLDALSVETFSDPDDVVPIDEVLACFTSLNVLSISNDSTFTDSIFRTLATLPISQLTFTCRHLSAVRLRELVLQSTTLKSLHIHLVALECEGGVTPSTTGSFRDGPSASRST